MPSLHLHRNYFLCRSGHFVYFPTKMIKLDPCSTPARMAAGQTEFPADMDIHAIASKCLW